MRRELTLSLTTLAMTLLGMVIVVAAIIVPSIRSIRTMSETIAREERALAQRAALGETIRTARETLQEVRSLLPQLETTFIRPDRQVEFVLALERLARTRGLVHKLTLAQNGGTTLPFHLTLSGNFRAIGRLVGDLARLPWYLSLESLDLVRQDQVKTITAELTLTGYLAQSSP